MPCAKPSPLCCFCWLLALLLVKKAFAELLGFVLETQFVIYYWVHPYLGWFIVTHEWLIQIRGGLFLLIPSVDEANIFSTIFEVISVNCHKKTWSFTVLSNRALLCSSPSGFWFVLNLLVFVCICLLVSPIFRWTQLFIVINHNYISHY